MISGTPKFAAAGTFEGCVGVGHDLTELRRHEVEASRKAVNLESILENIDQGVLLSLRQMAHDIVVRHAAHVAADPNTEWKTPTAIALRQELVRSGKRFVGERKQADGRTVSVSYNPLPGGGGVMACSDVTEARLEKSEARFRHLFMAFTDADVGLCDGLGDIVEVNDAAVVAYGYPREEFLRRRKARAT